MARRHCLQLGSDGRLCTWYEQDTPNMEADIIKALKGQKRYWHMEITQQGSFFYADGKIVAEIRDGSAY